MSGEPACSGDAGAGMSIVISGVPSDGDGGFCLRCGFCCGCVFNLRAIGMVCSWDDEVGVPWSC